MPLDPRAKRLLDMVALGGGGSVPATAAARRAGFRALMAMARPAVAVASAADVAVAGAGGAVLPARLYGPEGEGPGPRPGLVFFHGGGLVAGDLDTHDGLCRRLAAGSGARVLAVSYRLAPEHPFPAAMDDAVAATAAVAATPARYGMDGTRLGVGGDSAGGTLATLAAGAVGARRLRVQLLICPVLDHADRRPSRLAYGQGFMLDQAVMDRDLADLLPAGHDPADPRISPLRAPDLAGMPPALIHTAEYDPLRDEGEAYAAALALAGVPVRHTDHPGLIHHFVGLEGLIPAAGPALMAIAHELRDALAGDGGQPGTRL